MNDSNVAHDESALPGAIPAEETDVVLPEMEDPDAGVHSTGGAWTIPLLCAGISLIAACVLVPLADQNRQMVYEKQKLHLDVEQIKQQVSVNDEFLRKLGDDATLAERLAQRQMKTIRQGSAVVDLGTPEGKPEMSPFLLVSLPPPPELAPYRPLGGVLTRWCLSGKSRLFLIGLGLMSCAAGLVLGGTKKENEDHAPCDSD